MKTLTKTNYKATEGATIYINKLLDRGESLHMLENNKPIGAIQCQYVATIAGGQAVRIIK